jgi:nucleoside-diphosphate-sugar epimerase
VSTVVVLGAAGFLGRHVSKVLGASEEHRLVGVGRRPPTDWPGGIDAWRSLDLAEASVDDHVRLYKEEAAQIIINCAGTTSGEARQMLAGNVTLVDNLVGALGRLGSIRLVHLGSAAEYGCQPAGVPIAESASPSPVSEYGRYKLAATELIIDAAEQGHLDGTVLRVFNPVGAGAPVSSLAGRVAGILRDAVATGLDAIRLGPLSASRDFVAADDVAGAAARAAFGAGMPPVINVGSGGATCSRTLVLALATVAGFTGAIIEDEHGSTRSALVDWQAADISLLHRHLGRQPAIPLSDSLQQLWDFLV